jgi:phosphatidylserine/phosphatidylglycerophosphate/cardiolipin synthase-like enzyme
MYQRSKSSHFKGALPDRSHRQLGVGQCRGRSVRRRLFRAPVTGTKTGLYMHEKIFLADNTSLIIGS